MVLFSQKNYVEDAAFSFDQWEYFQVNLVHLGRLWLKQDSAEEKKLIVEDIFEEKILVTPFQWNI